MWQVRRVVGVRIPVKSYDDSTWEGGVDTSAMEHPGCGDQASDLQDELPREVRTAELSSGGIPGKSGDEDGNAGALRAPACHRHHGDYGGSKLPPPTVRPMQHAGPQMGLECTAPGHGTMCKGGGSGREDGVRRRRRGRVWSGPLRPTGIL